MSPVELMALILALLILLKIVVLIIKPKAWLSVIYVIYSKTYITLFSALVLASIVLIYLLQELTLVHIFASMLFLALLTIVSIALNFKDLEPFIKKSFNDREILKNSWLPILVWFILSLWVIYSIFINNNI